MKSYFKYSVTMKKEYSSPQTRVILMAAGERFADLQAVSDSADGDACIQEYLLWNDEEDGTISGSWKKNW